MENNINMYNKIKEILSPIYAVGGSLRDELLGTMPHDYDFATPLSPCAIEQKIRDVGRKPYLIGKRFGTIGVKIDGYYVEITTFRAEKYEKNNRKPNVEFVKDIIADLSRRDFTCNAISKRGNRYIDPFNGREDIKNKLIKCVGSAKARFKEDPLRMLRAARFASQLNFTISTEITEKMLKMGHKILTVSKERWVAELDKILLTDKPSIGLDILMKTRLFDYMMPELSLQYEYDQNSKYHDLTLWEHTKVVVDITDKDIILRWASLLHDVAKPFTRTDKYISENKIKSSYIKHDLLGAEIVEKIGRYLKWSNERRNKVKDIVLNHLKDDSVLREWDNMGKVRECEK